MPRRVKGETDREGQHCGYTRPSPKHPWRLVCHGPSWRACWLTLVEQTRDMDNPDLRLEAAKTELGNVPGAMTTIG